jgi:2-polyprenyl-3-methyl-5-hydroxy-6-metoxy-1,4-benzoquinol methylase
MVDKKMNNNRNVKDFSDSISFKDKKNQFFIKYCSGKKVLDIGCVQHNPENYKSKYWLHKVIKEVADNVVGFDINEDGVKYLKEKGFNVIHGDAQKFNFHDKFEVITAGDLIEHLSNVDGFIQSCKEHMNNESVLVISVPNPWYWKNIIKAILFKEVKCNEEHTCWYCARTIKQLFHRYQMRIEDIGFGSRYFKDKLFPLPSGIKHTTIFLALKKM